MNKKYTIFLVLLFISSAVLWAQRSPDAEMAKLYARYAWNAYQDQDWQEFANLVAKGVEFDAENPDLLCFQGMILLEDRDFRGVSEKYNAAFKNSNKTEFLKCEDILSVLSRMFYRLGEYREQTDLYYAVGEDNRDDPDFLFYSVLSFYALHEKETAIALAEEGVYRFQDQRFLILLCGWMENSGYPVILNEFLDREGMLYPDLMARLILQSPEGQGHLVKEYVSRTKDLNSWYLSALNKISTGESLIPGSAAESRVWPSSVIRAVWKEFPSQRGILNKLIPGDMLIDQSGDGIEDWIIRNEGETLVWTRDKDQDGFADFKIYWESGQNLSAIEYFHEDYTLRCYYYNYPFVDYIEIGGKDRNQREYLYLPGSYQLPLFENSEFTWQSGFDIDEKNIPFWRRLTESDHMKSCFSLKDSVTNGLSGLFREYTVINGSIKRFREDSNFDGHFDRMVLLKDWVPVEGYRDLNLDGVYDLKEIYSEGRLCAMEVQGDNSRIEEYYDLWNSKRYQLWDFDQTSFFDALLIQNGDLTWAEKPLNSKIFMQTGSNE